ncbi:MAG TPA: 1-acyl-sn-glycerol-3-phosphate acyltransferase [Thermoanaerobaculia bacterium]|nr:1-acyl-sn-glycerol-3-phosphate acyltransferase [Thermoanaerobaculia bacterium]
MPLPPLPRERPWPQRAVATLRGAVVAAALLSSLLLINLLQTASLALRPLSVASFRRFNRLAAATYWGACAKVTLAVHRTRVVFSGDAELPRENAVLIANHQSMADVQVLFLLARRERRLGDLKWFVKHSLKYWPGIGWGMTFLDCLFVRRDWAADRRRIEAVFSKLLRANVPVWLVSFVEGPRLSAAKLARARDYAAEQARELPRHVLLPRARGFVASVTGLTGHVGAVYDVTIGYVGGLPSLWQWAKGQMREVHLHVRRYPLAELPASPEALAAWLEERFREKDERLERFYAGGSLA